MTPRTVYPRSNNAIVALLELLGFEKRNGVGRGRHPEKYFHPRRRNIDPNDKPFVLVTHEYFDANGQRLMKKLQNWGYSKEELESACNGIAPPTDYESGNADIDVEPEGA